MTVKLKCDKCGHVVDWNDSKPRERRCKQTVDVARGLNPVKKYYCWGRLERQDATPKKQRTDLDMAEHCERQRAAAETKMRRAMTSMNMWSKRRKYYLAKAEGRIRREAKPQAERVKKDRYTREIEVLDDSTD